MESDVRTDASHRSDGMRRYRPTERDTYHALSCIHSARRALADAESYISGKVACSNPYERARLALALAEANAHTALEEAAGFLDSDDGEDGGNEHTYA